MTSRASCRILTASLIHRVVRSDSLTTRWIREAVKIRQEAQDVMKGVFLLSHVYDDLLLSAATTAATPSGELPVRKR